MAVAPPQLPERDTMPASSATETQTAANQRGGSSIDLNDKRYPRPKWAKALRWLLQRPWWLVAAIYFPLFASNLVVLGLQQGGGALLYSANWLEALELDKLLPSLLTQHPWWISVPSLVIVGLFILLGYLAFKDKDREQETLKRRKEQDEQIKLATELRAATEGQTKDIALKTASEIGTTTALEIVNKINERLAQQPSLSGHPVLEPQGPPLDHNELLPAPDHFVGRKEDLDWLLQQLQPGKTAAIIALGGLGGIGKTALAAVAVRELRRRGRFRDGVAVVLCQGLTDPADLLRRVLTRFDLFRRAPEAADLASLSDHAQRMLHQKKILVVLDNVEPELTDLEKVVAALRSAGATLLLTARHILPRIAVPLEASRMLDLLSEQEALDLFAQSLGCKDAASLSPGDQAAAKRIVATLERHTLAVKLAGAYTIDAKRDLATLAGELEIDPLKVPEGETPRAVSLAFAKSTEALPNDARWLFAALAAFPTVEFGRRAALALAKAAGLSDPETSLNLLVLRKLVEASTKETIPEDSDRERLRLHQLMRSFAHDHFDQWPEEQRRNAKYTLTSYYAWYSNQAPETALGADESNIVKLLEWAEESGEEELIVELCAGMAGFWRDEWHTSGGLRYLPWGLAAANKLAKGESSTSSFYLPIVLLSLIYGQILQNIGRSDEAEDFFKKCLPIFSENQNYAGESAVLSWLGRIALRRGRLSDANNYIQQALTICRKMHDRQQEGTNLYLLGRVAQLQGQITAAETYFKENLLIAREAKYKPDESTALIALGEISLLQGHIEEAERYFLQAMEISHDLKSKHSEGAALTALGKLALHQAQLEKAKTYFQQALVIDQAIQDRQGECVDLYQLGDIAIHQDSFDEAEQYFQQSLMIALEVQDRQGEGLNLYGLGCLSLMNGELKKAEDYLQSALVIIREIHDPVHETLVLKALDELSSLSRQLEQPHGQVSDAPPEEVHPILQAFVTTSSWEETRAFLEREQALLLTNTANQLLESWVIQAAQNNHTGQANYLNNHRILLLQARKLGIPDAWAEFERFTSPEKPEDEMFALTAEEAERAAQDAAFLAEKLGISADHPSVLVMQKQLRLKLAGDEQEEEAGDGAPPNE